MSEDYFNRKKELYEWQDLDFAQVSYKTTLPGYFRRSIIMVKTDNLDMSHVDLLKLMEGGMNVLRLVSNLAPSHEIPEVMAKLNKAGKMLAAKYGINGWSCATALELQSRNLTTGYLENKTVRSIILKKNTEVFLSNDILDFHRCNENRIFINNPYLATDATIGLEISISEDVILLEVTEVKKQRVKCIVTKGGCLTNMAPVCMKGAKRSRPYITKEDLAYVKMALENQMNMIIVNYVRHPNTIQKIKQFMGHNRRRPLIASGICTMEGLRNLDDILKESDVILFSREKLAYELDKKYFSRMVAIQKYVVGKCKQAGRPVYLGGQVFQSMLLTGILAHRDISDVANAILDGMSGVSINAVENTDNIKAVMQSLSNLCKQMEPFTCDTKTFTEFTEGAHDLPLNAAISAAMCCVLLANKTQSHAIIIPTVSGRTIYYVNQYLPLCPIIAVTTKLSVFHSLAMYRGVAAVLYEGAVQQSWKATVTNRLEYAVTYGLDKGWLNYGDEYVTLEKDFEESTFCDTVRIWKVTLKKEPGLSYVHTDTVLMGNDSVSTKFVRKI